MMAGFEEDDSDLTFSSDSEGEEQPSRRGLKNIRSSEVALKFPPIPDSPSTTSEASSAGISEPLLLDKDFPPSESAMRKPIEEHGEQYAVKYDHTINIDEGFAVLDPESEDHDGDDGSSVTTVSSNAKTEVSNAETVDVNETDSSDAEDPLLDAPLDNRQEVLLTSQLVDHERYQDRVDEKDGGSSIQDSELTIVPSTYKPRQIVGRFSSKIKDSEGSSGMTHFRMLMFSVVPSLAILILSMLITFFLTSTSKAPLSAVDEMSLRGDMLGHFLQTWDNATAADLAVKPNEALQYPTVTTINGRSRTTSVVFPTALGVYVAQPDRLYLSLPRASKYWSYPKDIRVKVSKDGKTIDAHCTHVIAGLVHVALQPFEAHGFIDISVLANQVNETVKIDLGSRLLQRATYEKAAVLVQQSVRRDMSRMQRMAEAVHSNVLSSAHLVFNASTSSANAIRNLAARSSSKISRNVAGKVNRTAATSRMMAKLFNKALVEAQSEAVEDIRKMCNATSQGVYRLGNNSKMIVSSAYRKLAPRRSLSTTLSDAQRNAIGIRNRVLGNKRTEVPVKLSPYQQALTSLSGCWNQAKNMTTRAIGNRTGKASQKKSTALKRHTTIVPMRHSTDTTGCEKTKMGCKSKVPSEKRNDVKEGRKSKKP